MAPQSPVRASAQILSSRYERKSLGRCGKRFKTSALDPGWTPWYSSLRPFSLNSRPNPPNAADGSSNSSITPGGAWYASPSVTELTGPTSSRPRMLAVSPTIPSRTPESVRLTQWAPTKRIRNRVTRCGSRPAIVIRMCFTARKSASEKAPGTSVTSAPRSGIR